MFWKKYIIHNLLLSLMVFITSFMIYVLFGSCDITQTIICGLIVILFFRKFYQMIIGSVVNSIFFIFSSKSLKIKPQKDGNYMIVSEIKNKDIFKYLNIVIDKLYNLFFKLFFIVNNSEELNKHFKFEFEPNDTNFIIIKRDIPENEAKKELKRIYRIIKLKNILN